jgi:hypothetical protein
LDGVTARAVVPQVKTLAVSFSSLWQQGLTPIERPSKGRQHHSLGRHVVVFCPLP